MPISEVIFGNITSTGYFTIDLSVVNGSDIIAPAVSRNYLSMLYHSYSDWGLFLELGWRIEPPQVKTNYVSVPYRDGDLDFTESLTGYPMFESREASMTFSYYAPYETAMALYGTVRNVLHGVKTPIFMPYQNGNYLIGRVSVGQYEYDPIYNKFSIPMTAVCEPWFYLPQVTTLALVSGANTVNNSTKPATPIVIVQLDSVTIGFGNNTWNLAPGSYKLPQLLLQSGANEVTFSASGSEGTGVATLQWQEAVL